MTQTDLAYTLAKDDNFPSCNMDLAQKRARLFALQSAILPSPDPLYEDFQPQLDEMMSLFGRASC